MYSVQRVYYYTFLKYIINIISITRSARLHKVFSDNNSMMWRNQVVLCFCCQAVLIVMGSASANNETMYNKPFLTYRENSLRFRIGNMTTTEQRYLMTDNQTDVKEHESSRSLSTCNIGYFSCNNAYCCKSGSSCGGYLNGFAICCPFGSVACGGGVCSIPGIATCCGLGRLCRSAYCGFSSYCCPMTNHHAVFLEAAVSQNHASTEIV